MNETWRPVRGFESYYLVSDQGRVMRVAPAQGTYPGYILEPRIPREKNPKGTPYPTVGLSGVGGERQIVPVHKLVCEAFHGPRPAGHQVNHKNGAKHDNRAENLEWVTPSQNVRHRFDVLGIRNLACEDHTKARFTNEQVQIIRKLSALGCVASHIAEQFGVPTVTVKMVVSGRNWKQLPIDPPAELPAGYTVITAEQRRAQGSEKRRKLSDTDVAAIRTRLTNGERGAALAREYGVTSTLVSQIKLGRARTGG